MRYFFSNYRALRNGGNKVFWKPQNRWHALLGAWWWRRTDISRHDPLV